VGAVLSGHLKVVCGPRTARAQSLLSLSGGCDSLGVVCKSSHVNESECNASAGAFPLEGCSSRCKTRLAGVLEETTLTRYDVRKGWGSLTRGYWCGELEVEAIVLI
jgi:hypothetical protein